MLEIYKSYQDPCKNILILKMATAGFAEKVKTRYAAQLCPEI
jgi:hypothetical protein